MVTIPEARKAAAEVVTEAGDCNQLAAVLKLQNQHWVAAVADMSSKIITVFDSLAGIQSEEKATAHCDMSRRGGAAGTPRRRHGHGRRCRSIFSEHGGGQLVVNRRKVGSCCSTAMRWASAGCRFIMIK